MPPQLEKSVPFWSFILTVLLLIGGGFAQASTAHYRLGELEQKLREQRDDIRAQQEATQKILQSLARIEERLQIQVQE